MKPQLFTIGHSTHEFDHFVELLKKHDVQLLIDVRRFPGSRKFPQFNQEHLADNLPRNGIAYRWMESLGGRRKVSKAPSKNTGLRNASFQSYADYMLTEPFREAVDQLIAKGTKQRTCFMCSESVFWRCHRRLISDYLLTHDITAQHIMPSGELRPHGLTQGAQIQDGELTYPAAADNQPRLWTE